MTLEARAQVYAALGDRSRLAMVDELLASDRTVAELAHAAGLPGNLAAHHLDVLEAAGLIERHPSEGDHRRRYVTLRQERLEGMIAVPPMAPGLVLFVCTHNSARSQFAAALWERRTGHPAASAGTQPAAAVHPLAIEVAAEFGIDLRTAVPKGYALVTVPPDLVVSVCDRAREAGVPFPVPLAHWSVPDPIAAGSIGAFRSAFAQVAQRVDRVAEATPH